MRAAGDRADGARLRGLIDIRWGADLSKCEALDLWRPILMPHVERCSCGTARADAAARSGWTGGPGSSSSRGSRSADACLRRVPMLDSPELLVPTGTNRPQGSSSGALALSPELRVINKARAAGIHAVHLRFAKLPHTAGARRGGLVDSPAIRARRVHKCRPFGNRSMLQSRTGVRASRGGATA